MTLKYPLHHYKEVHIYTVPRGGLSRVIAEYDLDSWKKRDLPPDVHEGAGDLYGRYKDRNEAFQESERLRKQIRGTRRLMGMKTDKP